MGPVAQHTQHAARAQQHSTQALTLPTGTGATTGSFATCVMDLKLGAFFTGAAGFRGIRVTPSGADLGASPPSSLELSLDAPDDDDDSDDDSDDDDADEDDADADDADADDALPLQRPHT